MHSKLPAAQLGGQRDNLDVLVVLGSLDFELNRTSNGSKQRVVTAHADGHSAAAELRDSHDNITRVWQDGALVEDHMPAEANEAAPADWPLTLARVYEFATTAPLEEISFILEAARMNRQGAEEGLSSQYGLGVGKSMDARVRKHILSDDLPTFAIRLTAAAADARMAGVMMPVMSNSGSGNQGITCSVPLIEYAKELHSGKEKLYRALIISNLVAIHEKTGIGTLSAYCGAVSAGAGAGAGIVYLCGDGYQAAIHTVVNALAIVSGIVCDGAKASCAAKIASSVDAALLGYNMYKCHQEFKGGDGIVMKDIETTIKGIGRLGKDGMKETNEEIIRLMIE